MAIYNIIFIMLAVMSFLEIFDLNKRKRLSFFSIIMITIFLVLTTIRGGSKGDYKNYKNVYMYMTDTTYLFKTSNFLFEPFYSCLQWICKKVINNFQFFLFVIGSIVIFIEHNYAKKFRISSSTNEKGYKEISDRKYYFTIFFILWGLYLANIFVIRSTISLMICFYSIYYIQEKKISKFLVCIAVATGFHYSALVFLPAYFVFWFRSSILFKINFFIFGSILLSAGIRPIALIAARLLGGTTENKIKTYLGSTSFMFGLGMDESDGAIILAKALLNIGVILLVGIYCWKFNKKDILYEGCLNLYIVGCILYIATLTVGYAFARLSIYYNIFQIPILIYVIRGNRNANKNRVTYWLMFVIYILLRYVVNNIGTSFVTFWQ